MGSSEWGRGERREGWREGVGGGRYGGKVSGRRAGRRRQGEEGRQRRKTSAVLHFHLPPSPPRKTPRHPSRRLMAMMMKEVGSPTAVTQSGDGKGGRGREDGAKESKFSLAGISFISRAAANTCLGMQAGEPLTTARCDVTKGSYAFRNGGCSADTRSAASEMWKKKQQNITGFKV